MPYCKEKYTLHAVCCGDNVGIGDHAGAADVTPSAIRATRHAALPRPWVTSGFHAADDTCLGRRCSRSEGRTATEHWIGGRLWLVVYIRTDINHLINDVNRLIQLPPPTATVSCDSDMHTASATSLHKPTSVNCLFICLFIYLFLFCIFTYLFNFCFFSYLFYVYGYLFIFIVFLYFCSFTFILLFIFSYLFVYLFIYLLMIINLFFFIY